MEIEFLFEAVLAEREAHARAVARVARVRLIVASGSASASAPRRRLARLVALLPLPRPGAARAALRRTGDT